MTEDNLYRMAKRVYHRNDARPALIGMGLGAKRIFLSCLAQLPRETSKNNVIIDFNPEQEFIITVKWYSETCRIDYAAAYRQLVEGVEELRGYVLRPANGLLKKPNPDDPKDWIEPFTIAERGTGYSKGEGYIKVKFAPEMTPLISGLRDSFTGLFFMSVMHLPDGNAGKLYLILREWISSGYLRDRTVLFNDFKDMLGVSNLKAYDVFTEFQNSFVRRASRKIIEKTEFNDIKMEIVERRARKAYKVKITYEYDLKAIEVKDKAAEKIMASEPSKREKEVNKQKIEALFFAETQRYLDRNSAKAMNLDWSTGITAKELLKQFKK